MACLQAVKKCCVVMTHGTQAVKQRAAACSAHNRAVRSRGEGLGSADDEDGGAQHGQQQQPHKQGGSSAAGPQDIQDHRSRSTHHNNMNSRASKYEYTPPGIEPAFFCEAWELGSALCTRRGVVRKRERIQELKLRESNKMTMHYAMQSL